VSLRSVGPQVTSHPGSATAIRSESSTEDTAPGQSRLHTPYCMLAGNNIGRLSAVSTAQSMGQVAALPSCPLA